MHSNYMLDISVLYVLFLSPKSSCFHYTSGFYSILLVRVLRAIFKNFESHPNCKDEDTEKID